MVLEDWIRSKYVRKEFLKRPGASNDRVDPGTHPALPSPLPDSPHFSPSLFTVTASCSVTCGRAVKSKADELCGWSGVEAYEKTGWMDKSGGAKTGVQSA